MNEFSIYYHPVVVEKEIPRLERSLGIRIKKAIELKLASQPTAHSKPLQGSLKGLRSLRVGDWRVIFEIMGKEIWILTIGHRREVYEQRIGRLRQKKY